MEHSPAESAGWRYKLIIAAGCVVVSLAFAAFAVVVQNAPEYRSVLEFITGTWPGTTYVDLFEQKNSGLLFTGVFLRVLVISLVAIILSVLASGFITLRREVMKLESLILDRDDFVKSELRAAFLKSLRDGVKGDLGKVIDEALKSGSDSGHDKRKKLTARHTERGERILGHEI